MAHYKTGEYQKAIAEAERIAPTSPFSVRARFVQAAIAMAMDRGKGNARSGTGNRWSSPWRDRCTGPPPGGEPVEQTLHNAQVERLESFDTGRRPGHRRPRVVPHLETAPTADWSPKDTDVVARPAARLVSINYLRQGKVTGPRFWIQHSRRSASGRLELA